SGLTGGLQVLPIHRDGANFLFMYWVYILQNPRGTFYIGHADNLPGRLASHNDTGPAHGKFTRQNGPRGLVWSEEHPTRSMAMARERQIQRMKSAQWIRENLLHGRVPRPRD
ncbi:MAG TPA: GIY-YIG nuclease family protein, partial [Verrucomicrobiota bacterium]|nr:GIY-YIG nuclease family protein [Verrucomicrobiota bacterium]